MKKTLFVLFIAWTFLLFGFYENPYASRIRPGSTVPSTCAENEVFYSMTLHKLYICTNSGYVPMATNGGTIAANAVIKSNGTNFVASQITDDGTDVAIIASSIELNSPIVVIGDIDGTGNSTKLTLDDAAETVSLDVNSIFRAHAIQSITPGGSQIGDVVFPFSAIAIGGAAGNTSTITGTFTANRTATVPDQTGTVGILLTNSASLNFANQAAIGCNDLTITVTGATLSDTVSLGVPNASVVNATAFFKAWVSSSNTVTVRYCQLISGDPAAGTFKVDVWKH